MKRVIIDLDDNYSDLLSFTVIGHEATFFATHLCVATKVIEPKVKGVIGELNPVKMVE